MNTIKSIIEQPAVFVLLVLGALYLATLIINAFHKFVVSWKDTHTTAAAKALGLVLDLVDTTLTVSLTGITADVNAAKADGLITPAEFSDIAKKELARIKQIIGDNLLATLEKGLGLGGAALDAYLQQLVANRLSFKLAAPAK